MDRACLLALGEIPNWPLMLFTERTVEAVSQETLLQLALGLFNPMQATTRQND
jgi:hypothetical protein